MTPAPPLACTVRGCHQALTRRGAAYACDRGHTFDLARSGYLNLLQPQDRRSLDAGDHREAVAARSRLLAQGIGGAVIDAVATAAASACGSEAAVVVDLGCGAGELLGRLVDRPGITGIGFDLSTDAAARAARRFPAQTWVVANADRRLPLLDGCARVVVSVHARRNPAESRRALEPQGLLIVAVPAADDLHELRALVQGEAVSRDRAVAVIAEHDAAFAISEHRTVRETHVMSGAALEDLLIATYRSARGRRVPAEAAQSGLTVTLASEVLTFTPRD
jgi:23S rRNA (guanine745-N1)-methyltransferase